MASCVDLRDRVVVLTGGAGILGARMAAALLAHGAKLAILDRDAASLDAIQSALQADNGRVFGVLCDVSDRGQVEQARNDIVAALGPVDVLINNAASKSEHFFEPFETFPVDDWNYVMSVNLNGAVTCCQVFGNDMAQRGCGSIINTLSIYGIVAPDQRIYEGSNYEGRAINTPAVYSASKAALWGLTKYLASYWGHRGVRVNALTPGGVYSGQNDIFVAKYAARVPLGRMAEPDEMSGAIVFLASDASSYVTGQNLIVDGGLTTW